MKEVNYNETVILPLLQKKIQDLMNSNLIFEAHLLVEQTKNKDLQLRLDELQAKLDSLSTKKKKKEEPTLDGETY
jgi:hypothetical protein